MLATFAGCFALSRRLSGTGAVFGYLLLVTVPPDAVDLVSKLHAQPTVLEALGRWEGGMWLTVCLPLATLLLLERPRRHLVRVKGDCPFT